MSEGLEKFTDETPSCMLCEFIAKSKDLSRSKHKCAPPGLSPVDILDAVNGNCTMFIARHRWQLEQGTG